MTRKNKVVWLTGSAHGVGKHLTSCFLQRGYNVVATDIDALALQNTAQECRWDKENLLQLTLDITDVVAWQGAFERALERFSGIDILLNIAGYIKPGFLMETAPEEMKKHIDVNLIGTMIGSQLVAKQMLAQGSGHIINIASLAGIAPVSGLGFYSASKFGVRGYSLALAHELAEKNIAVTVIYPDLIKTRMYDLQLDYEKESALVFTGRKPLTVEDIAKAVFDTALKKHPMEILLPKSRGFLARIGGNYPALAYKIGLVLRKQGEAKIAAAKKVK